MKSQKRISQISTPEKEVTVDGLGDRRRYVYGFGVESYDQVLSRNRTESKGGTETWSGRQGKVVETSELVNAETRHEQCGRSGQVHYTRRRDWKSLR